MPVSGKAINRGAGAVALALLSIGIPALFSGVELGAVCVGLVVLMALVLLTPLRDWLGIPREGSDTSPPGSTAVRVRGSKGVIARDNIAIGTDSAVDVADSEDVFIEGNRVIRGTGQHSDEE